uniref:Integral membrane single c2 domain protein n=1 Tax=Tetraselmis sp. GSL018 TaxID=582737 RepID=A0A061SBL8_9CHLO|eukprot:CAMPEP_0177587170 /NCGR_PEP_ID=MMETSP0419_2-20121207/5487_1 /TAXON_ID=582737 /ORGANISM="Tetraselmis sp., Strain GSL018" /LENGTH=796 /DNA_ID=CAMNT_0019077159 /DNA_START=224 /DNA_END=2614 /DNA_ORIENTATION=-
MISKRSSYMLNESGTAVSGISSSAVLRGSPRAIPFFGEASSREIATRHEGAVARRWRGTTAALWRSGASGGSSQAASGPLPGGGYSREALEWLEGSSCAETQTADGGSSLACAVEASGSAAVGRADANSQAARAIVSPPPTCIKGDTSAVASLGHDFLLLMVGAIAALTIRAVTTVRRFLRAGSDHRSAGTRYYPEGEPVEWVNMCWRKMWRVYQRGLERWIVDLLQPLFDSLIDDVAPRSLRRLKIVEFTLDHEAPTFSNMRRRNSRKDSDLSGVVDCRYTGGAKLLLQIEVGFGGLKSIKVPVMVSDLDFQGKLWIKLRLAPMCPWIGTIFLAFVGPPKIQVQLSPYNRVPLMRVPILQKVLAKLLTEELPGMMVLPERLEIVIPPAVTAVAEAAVGRDAIMQAVASAVLQADTLEASLASALPLGQQGAAGGICLPDSFVGEVAVLLREGKNLPVWGTSLSSNPWCRLVLGEQAVISKRNNETSTVSDHRNPVWNQEFQFLVQDPITAVLEFYVKDSHLTGRTEVGYARLPLIDVPTDSAVALWIPVEAPIPGQPSAGGELLVEVCYKPFEDDDSASDDAYSTFVEELAETSSSIVDIKSAADASSRANAAQSAAMAAVAVTKAAAARAATRAAQAAQAAGSTTFRAAQGAAQIAGSTTKAAASQLSRVNPLSSADFQREKERASPAGDGSTGAGNNGANPPDNSRTSTGSTTSIVHSTSPAARPGEESTQPNLGSETAAQAPEGNFKRGATVTTMEGTVDEETTRRMVELAISKVEQELEELERNRERQVGC